MSILLLAVLAFVMSLSLFTGPQPPREPVNPVVAALRGIVAATWRGATCFVTLPLIYPAGTFVTVKITEASGGFLVSDGGFGYRELEQIGAERSFGRSAKLAAEQFEVNRDTRGLFVIADASALGRAVCDVAAASWQMVDRVYRRQDEEDDAAEFEDLLLERLVSIFGKIASTQRQ